MSSMTTYIHTHIHTYIHTYIHKHIHTCIHTYNACMHIYIYTYIHAHTHAKTHAHMHTSGAHTSAMRTSNSSTVRSVELFTPSMTTAISEHDWLALAHMNVSAALTMTDFACSLCDFSCTLRARREREIFTMRWHGGGRCETRWLASRVAIDFLDLTLAPAKWRTVGPALSVLDCLLRTVYLFEFDFFHYLMKYQWAQSKRNERGWNNSVVWKEMRIQLYMGAFANVRRTFCEKTHIYQCWTWKRLWCMKTNAYGKIIANRPRAG